MHLQKYSHIYAKATKVASIGIMALILSSCGSHGLPEDYDTSSKVGMDHKSYDFGDQESYSVSNSIRHTRTSTLSGNSKEIYIIGDSTVHNNFVPDGNGGFKELGWGDVIGEYAVNSSYVVNKAAGGASSKSYRPDWYWGKTKRAIESDENSVGGYLLIQFGHNDVKNDERYTSPGVGNTYYSNLKYYVDEARRLDMIPVLVTSVERIFIGKKGHGEYPQTMRVLAKNEGVLLLDLEKRSYDKFSLYSDQKKLEADFSYDEHTHLNPNGARKVASWVRDLACESSDKTLCALFK